MRKTDVEGSKAKIRVAVLKKRDSIHQAVKKLKDSAIKERLLSLKEFSLAKNILFYASFRSEVETMEMIKESILIGKNVFLPSVDIKTHYLKIYRVGSVEELMPGYMGIPEPLKKGRTKRIDSIDLVVMPGIAFDTKGMRLGYGKGYYDRLLSHAKKKPLLMALAYEEQIVGHIPKEGHDIRVNALITEKRVIWTKKRLKKA